MNEQLVFGLDHYTLLLTFAAILLVTVICALFSKSSPSPSSSPSGLTCPGLVATHAELGNLGEITIEGGLHTFLQENHLKLGPIFTFYWCKDVAVSIASPMLFKDVETLFDRSLEPFEVFKPLIGATSIQFMNGATGGRAHRKLHDRQYSHAAMPSHFTKFCTIAADLVEKWSKFPEGAHIGLTHEMLSVAVQSLVRSSFGEGYITTREEMLELHQVGKGKITFIAKTNTFSCS